MKDISVSFATTGVIQVANIVTGLLAARLLLPEGRGELAEIMLWPGLLAELGILALSDALLYRAATRAAPPRQLFASIFSLAAVLSVALVAIGLVVLPVFIGHDSANVQAIAPWYLAAYLPTYFTALFIATMFQGQLDLVTWNLVRVLVPLGYLLAIVVAYLVAAADVAGFVACYVAAHVLSIAVGLPILFGRGWIGFSPRIETMKGLVVYGAKVHLGEMLNSLRQRLDQALVALWLSSAELGFYVVALTLANAPQILIHTVANIAFPKISQEANEAKRFEQFGRYLRLSVGVAAASCLGLAVLSPWIVPLLFGAAFAPATPIVQVLLIGMVPLAAKVLFMQALKAWDRPLVISRAEVAGLVVAAACLAGLLPALGVIGAAWSLVVAQIVSTAVLARALRRELGTRLTPLIVPQHGDWVLVTGFLRRPLE